MCSGETDFTFGNFGNKTLFHYVFHFSFFQKVVLMVTNVSLSLEWAILKMEFSCHLKTGSDLQWSQMRDDKMVKIKEFISTRKNSSNPYLDTMASELENTNNFFRALKIFSFLFVFSPPITVISSHQSVLDCQQHLQWKRVKNSIFILIFCLLRSKWFDFYFTKSPQTIQLAN